MIRLLHRPAGPTQWDRDTLTRITNRVRSHGGSPEEQERLIALASRAKLDGDHAKLADLLGLTLDEFNRRLRAGYVLLAHDPQFHRRFHHIRSLI
jgi:hypothetical protein